MLEAFVVITVFTVWFSGLIPAYQKMYLRRSKKPTSWFDTRSNRQARSIIDAIGWPLHLLLFMAELFLEKITPDTKWEQDKRVKDMENELSGKTLSERDFVFVSQAGYGIYRCFLCGESSVYRNPTEARIGGCENCDGEAYEDLDTVMKQNPEMVSDVMRRAIDYKRGWME